MPIINIMIDTTCGFEKKSFIDDFLGYNQVKMPLDDEKHTSFRTPLGVYCYRVILFRLKNTGATYHRAMSTIFRDHLRKMLEYYVDDIAVKSHSRNNHLDDLRTMFDIMQAHPLKMNSTKSFLGVSSGKLFEFIITLHPKKFTLILTKSRPFRACNL